MNRTEQQKALREHQKAIKEEIEEIRVVLQEEGSELAEKQLKDYEGLSQMLLAFQDEFARLNGGDEAVAAELAALQRVRGQNEPAKNEPKKEGADQTDMAVSLLELAEKRQAYPWFQSAKILDDERNSFQKQFNTNFEATRKNLRDRFRDFVKAKRLTPEQVVTLTYLLFSEEKFAPFLVANWMLSSTDPVEMVKRHNWALSAWRSDSEHYRTSHGNKLMHLEWPMFPDDADLGDWNLKLLESVKVTHDGKLKGGDTKAEPEKLFKTALYVDAGP